MKMVISMATKALNGNESIKFCYYDSYPYHSRLKDYYNIFHMGLPLKILKYEADPECSNSGAHCNSLVLYTSTVAPALVSNRLPGAVFKVLESTFKPYNFSSFLFICWILFFPL